MEAEELERTAAETTPEVVHPAPVVASVEAEVIMAVMEKAFDGIGAMHSRELESTQELERARQEHELQVLERTKSTRMLQITTAAVLVAAAGGAIVWLVDRGHGPWVRDAGDTIFKIIAIPVGMWMAAQKWWPHRQRDDSSDAP